MTNEQICKVLLDTDTETTVTSDSPLKMEEDYQLAIKSVDVNGRKVQLELSKKGKVVDSKVIGLPDENANIGDGTYYYRRNLGDTKEIVIIAVHFKRIFASSNANIAIIDGIFQISDTPTSLRAGKHYDMMSVSMVDPIAMTIEMDNKGNEITLSQNKYISLMWPVGIHTADQDSISSANPLRYYIYKSVSIKGETATVIKAVTEKAEAKDAEKNVIAEVEETKKNNTTKAVAVEEGQNITAKLKAANENSTPYIAAIQQPDLKRLPGFESTFALTGLLSLAWILLTRERQTKGP
jgi:S-layer protein (TIGR01567 family)